MSWKGSRRPRLRLMYKVERFIGGARVGEARLSPFATAHTKARHFRRFATRRLKPGPCGFAFASRPEIPLSAMAAVIAAYWHPNRAHEDFEVCEAGPVGVRLFVFDYSLRG